MIRVGYSLNNFFLPTERDLIGVQPNTQRLTFLASTSDFEETLNLPYHLLHRYGNITMNSRLIDSHIYVIKKWVIDFMCGVSSNRKLEKKTKTKVI